jgi:nucleotidyltransferase substrate binding protein (TIGR01987 family)
MINITPLKKALTTLEEILVRYDKEKNDDAVRDACVKRFEYTYELSVRTLKRYLRETEASIPEDELISFKNLIRLALTRGILKSSVKMWEEYRDARNLTSHTYEIKNAEKVIEVACDLAKEVKEYVFELEKRINKERNL